jgi:superfamily I DNA/RNA helicase
VASGVRAELQTALEALQEKQRLSSKEKDDLQKLRKRNGNLDTLVKLARNIKAYTETPVLGLDEVETLAGFGSTDGDDSAEDGASSSSSDSSSSLPLLQPTTGLPLLQQLYDYCVLQDEDEEEAGDTRKVQLMTMHASKGKEFACVTVLRAHEGSIPSIRKDEVSNVSTVLEQERNLLYVAISRAKE